MNNMKKTSFLLMILVIISNTSIIFANDEHQSYEQVKSVGELVGYYDGILHKQLPTIDEIIKRYEDYYNNQSTIYREYFIEGYYIGFNKSYSGSINDDNPTENNFLNYADILGLVLGEIYGNKDFYDGEKYNPTRFLPSNNTLISDYNLNRLSYSDKSQFLNSFKEKYKAGYREGYNRANFSSINISYEDGIRDGENFGSTLGRIDGIQDYYNNRTRSFKRNIPSDKDIKRKYSLNRNGERYSDGFLAEFKIAYQESYNESFRSINTEENIKPYTNGYESGKTSGLIQGDSNAVQDFYLNLENNWKRYYPTQASITKEFNLVVEDKDYRRGFISGYLEGLSNGYRIRFQQLHNERINNKTKVQIIPISGGEVKLSDDEFSLYINEGTYYNPVVITTNILQNNYYSIAGELIKTSDFYRIEIANRSNEVNNEEYIELSFEYYGKYNGGIYKLVDGRWIYLPSRIEDGIIKTKVKPNSFKNEENVYSVFVDKNYEILFDVRSHWAKDEITAFQRRGIVSGYSDGIFRPDEYITKGEFFTVLSKVYNWQIINYNELSYLNVINYALNQGYIKVDDAFNVDDPISYNEIEMIMRKVFDSDNFYWDNIASKMLYERQYKSKSYYNKTNYMTRAEAIYMLYILNEWRY
ncbi:S-layer homology domain-containing protein [Schnuerera sp. xch1]|uniref:S-layer homology domain-containing protein n=1 Tax=Schnuerera sp. xch1 TaxID=2874283 RepID=UPI001CBCF43D|nr:S-layer homology domain-containing protein [Schnuerera sp. xch1]MBZ2173734.1 S-layer homology domain-containing protein [Schnuerera sp. xch1]